MIAARPGTGTGYAQLVSASPATPPAAWIACLALTLALLPGRAGQEQDELTRARAYQGRVEGVIARVRSAVVTVGVPEGGERRLGRPRGQVVRSGGSGVIIAGGYVLTCEHVTEGRDEVLVGLADGRTLEGRVVGRDRMGDVALIKLAGDLRTVRHVELGDSRALRAGDVVIALGNPFGLARDDHEAAATLGIVSALHRYQGGARIYGDALQIDAAVNPGNSGGPLIDMAGKLVGLNGRISLRGVAHHNVGVGFAVPIHQIQLVLAALKAGRDVQRGYLGVRFPRKGDGAAGVEILAVVRGSPAERAGLQVGERITRVNGLEVTNQVRLKNYLVVLPAGTRVRLELTRQGRKRVVPVTLTARKRGNPR